MKIIFIIIFTYLFLFSNVMSKSQSNCNIYKKTTTKYKRCKAINLKSNIKIKESKRKISSNDLKNFIKEINRKKKFKKTSNFKNDLQ